MVRILSRHVVFMVLLCSAVTVKSATPKQGWHVHHQGNYYFFPEDGLSWPDARAACEEQGGHLVEIGSAAEQTFLESVIAQIPDSARLHLWIGLNDRYQEGHFVWENTGRPGFYTNWGSSPSNSNAEGYIGEDCVHLHWHDAWNWNDSACARIYRFICEL